MLGDRQNVSKTMNPNLQDFVNRESAISVYEELLEAPKPQILLLHGAAGIGKTFLLSYLHKNHVSQSVQFIHLDFRRSGDFLQISDLIDNLRNQCDDEFDEQLGAAELCIVQGLTTRSVSDSIVESLGKTISHAVAPATNQLSLSGDIHAQDIFIGNKIVISNSELVLNPDNGQRLLNKEMNRHRSRTLRSALLDLAKRRDVYLFIDHCDEAPEETIDWFLYQVLTQVIEKSDENHRVFIVVACRDISTLNRAKILQETMKPVELLAFSNEVSVQFWTKTRSLDEQFAVAMARASAGHPATLALLANNFAMTAETASENAK